MVWHQRFTTHLRSLYVRFGSSYAVRATQQPHIDNAAAVVDVLGAARSACMRFGSTYASLSLRWPHLVAAGTAASIIGAADLSCQSTLQRDNARGTDWVRTLGVTVFAAWHYGVPTRALYFWYDRFFGMAPLLSTAFKKMFVDVYIHSPLLLIPSYYAITGAIRGDTADQIARQLRAEWFTASFGTALYWTPLCLINFYFVPQHSRILFVSAGLYMYNTWLSWLSNKHRQSEKA
eukprot:gnl/MRDRNA2_/MRDRNA2_34523_c0_seq1.p1 gnl/MRDRNA2_/MRDRNA2_34523_c0~~gnl/MRDRNA2_/MRDRNA2_34523_c0_seq1.p1  ORF type:complete len:234 (+),score=20.23 gnl/MRDRNA2_/MRDRNA2_34523_c0_seq1:78-779(+)